MTDNYFNIKSPTEEQLVAGYQYSRFQVIDEVISKRESSALVKILDSFLCGDEGPTVKYTVMLRDPANDTYSSYLSQNGEENRQNMIDEYNKSVDFYDEIYREAKELL